MAPLRQHRQMLANLDARRLRRTRLELATDVVRSRRLHVEAILLGETAGEKDVDASLGLPQRSGCSRRGCCLRPESLQVVHPESEQTDSAGLDHGPAGEVRVGEGGGW